MTSQTIAAIATPLAVGGVAMIRISGSGAIEAADRVFHTAGGKKLCEKKGYEAAYGTIGLEGKPALDDGVALVYRAPKSYTGEDVVEISCHGGILITRQVLRLILEQGVRMAEPGEFSKRAFLNGKMSLTQAESIMDLIQSQNTQAMRSARAQMDGALFRKIQQVKDQLIGVAGHLAAWVDYPEEEIEELDPEHFMDTLQSAKTAVDQLLSTFDTGKLLREGIETAIVGKPNVGKSTLMNLLAGCEKSIVTDIAGTTRDVVEEQVNLGNAVLRLADTAGIHSTDDVVEQFGVEKALERIRTAGLVLAVFDYSVPLTEDDRRIIGAIREQNIPAIGVINKTDLPRQLEEEELKKEFAHLVFTSVEDPQAVALLSREIEQVLSLSEVDPAAAMLSNERQRMCSIRAQEALADTIATLQYGYTLDAVSVSLDTAIEALLELTGERVTDTVVDQVFHNFCVGK
ncbi:MAG: tRNA uridine-5-carboxymethylaminomethyl(34) synthesis GTPase MnmE [Massiliimalia sp.]|jgi:tRNA modification GTPase